jgi:hypothetical protein
MYSISCYKEHLNFENTLYVSKAIRRNKTVDKVEQQTQKQDGGILKFLLRFLKYAWGFKFSFLWQGPFVNNTSAIRTGRPEQLGE